MSGILWQAKTQSFNISRDLYIGNTWLVKHINSLISSLKISKHKYTYFKSQACSEQIRVVSC